MYGEQDELFGTYFNDREGRRLASLPGIVPIPLTKGMSITIHGFEGTYEVVDWNFHVGHGDEEAGLRIIVKQTSPNRAGTWGTRPQ